MRTIAEDMIGLPANEMPMPTLMQNEFECLNLNITRPGGIPLGSRLPVMIWIHGGCDRGAGSSWVYDAGKLVRKSVEMGKPVMVVTPKYGIRYRALSR
jgi:carboxylesterase type B